MANNSSSQSTDIAKVRYFGSARSGTGDNWRMRLTSAALIPLTIAFVWLILSLVGKDYNGVRMALGSPLQAIVILLFILAGVYHMQLGMRSIIFDYVHEPRLKEWSLIANACFCAVIALACVYSVLRIGFA
jgi:succinate dehydrogenase / fumarate reductase, membrane anchor subunit